MRAANINSNYRPRRSVRQYYHSTPKFYCTMENTILCRQRGATIDHVSLATDPYPALSVAGFQPSAFRLALEEAGICSPPYYAAPLFAFSFAKCKKLNPLFSNSSALFKKVYSANSFAIKGFRTLLQNTRVAPTLDRFSTPPCNPSQKGTPASPLPATLAAPVTNKSIVCRSYRNTGGVRPSVCRNAHTTLCKLSVKRRQKRFSDFENYRQY